MFEGSLHLGLPQMEEVGVMYPSPPCQEVVALDDCRALVWVVVHVVAVVLVEQHLQEDCQLPRVPWIPQEWHQGLSPWKRQVHQFPHPSLFC